MYENTTYEVILQRMLDRVSDKLDKREGSVIFDTISPTSIEFQILYLELDNILKEVHGDTASREFLILRCKERGITPYTATHTILKGEFTPTNIDLAGKRFNIGEINYTVTEQIEPGKYQVKCETSGEIGNQHLGVMIPMDYIDGLATAELTQVLIPGEDNEDTEVLRKRYFDSFNEQNFGGNRADYLKKVRSIDGVGNVKITRVWNGDIRPADMIPSANVTAWYKSVIGGLEVDVATWLSAVYMASFEKKLTVGGTVLLTVTNSLDYGTATTVLLNGIQTVIDPVQNAGEGYGLAPIGHVVSVRSAEAVDLTITTDVTFDEGYSWSNTKTAIQEAVDAYLLELRKSWADSNYTVVRISQIETRILTVKGIIDIANTKINDSTNNMTLTKYQIPMIGGVSA